MEGLFATPTLPDRLSNVEVSGVFTGVMYSWEVIVSGIREWLVGSLRDHYRSVPENWDAEIAAIEGVQVRPIGHNVLGMRPPISIEILL